MRPIGPDAMGRGVTLTIQRTIDRDRGKQNWSDLTLYLDDRVFLEDRQRQ